MIGLYRIVLWAFVFHLSAQNNISKLRYKRFKSNLSWDVAVETNLTNEIQNKAVVSNREWYVPVVTEQCESMGICEDVPNYPEEHVTTMVQEARWLHPLKFDADFKFLNSETLPQEVFRFQSDNYEELCRSETKYITPRAAKNINNEWQFIVNTKDRPSQTFSVEVCKNPMNPCSNIVTFASNYYGWCQQKFIFRNMVAINKYGELIEDPHQLPSCCSCVYKDNNYF